MTLKPRNARMHSSPKEPSAGSVRENPSHKKTIQPDTETRLTEGDHQALRLWLRLLACTNLIEGIVRERLKGEFAITLPRFDLMAQLQRSPAGLSMGELSQRLMVTGGNVTGIVAALEAEGLIVREPDPDDRRISRVRLTDAGETSFARMAKAHEQWIVNLFAGLTAQEQAGLSELLGRLKAHACQVRDEAV